MKFMFKKINKGNIESAEIFCDKIRKNLNDVNLKVTSVGELSPRIMIFNVAFLPGFKVEETTLKPAYKFESRNKHYVHKVVGVSPNARELLIDKDNILLNWHSNPIEDNITLPKLRCQHPICCNYCTGNHDSRRYPIINNLIKYKYILCTKINIKDKNHRARYGRYLAFQIKMEQHVARKL